MPITSWDRSKIMLRITSMLRGPSHRSLAVSFMWAFEYVWLLGQSAMLIDASFALGSFVVYRIIVYLRLSIFSALLSFLLGNCFYLSKEKCPSRPCKWSETQALQWLYVHQIADIVVFLAALKGTSKNVRIVRASRGQTSRRNASSS